MLLAGVEQSPGQAPGVQRVDRLGRSASGSGSNSGRSGWYGAQRDQASARSSTKPSSSGRGQIRSVSHSTSAISASTSSTGASVSGIGGSPGSRSSSQDSAAP